MPTSEPGNTIITDTIKKEMMNYTDPGVQAERVRKMRDLYGGHIPFFARPGFKKGVSPLARSASMMALPAEPPAKMPGSPSGQPAPQLSRAPSAPSVRPASSASGASAGDRMRPRSVGKPATPKQMTLRDWAEFNVRNRAIMKDQ